jgi:type II secretory pathway pseudopilin PulG
MKKIIKLKNSDEGVAGVIIALLMIGLIISAISLVQAVFVPQWMKQREAEHMEEVAKQFSQLKFAVDTLIISGNSISSINCPITLGSKEMPFLFSSRSYGELEVRSNDYKIDIDDSSGNTYSFDLSSIVYNSHNAYYINQNYVFENGAVILNQDSGDTIKLYPNIDINEYPPKITMNLVNFKEIGGKTVASGYGTYPIQARYSYKGDTHKFSSVQNITIYNSHLDAWEKYLNSTLSSSGALNFTINYYGDGLKIQFFAGDGYHYPNIDMYIHNIDVKITPGWVE